MAESSVRVFILSVTRDLGDSLGGELAEAVTAAGHTLAGRDMVQPELEAVKSALARRLADAKVQAVIVVGAAQRWGEDAGSRAVSAKLARPLPGLAEHYRALALPQAGAAALLDDVVGGLTEAKKVVFALPESPETALLAARQIVLPLVGTLLERAAGAWRAEEPTKAAAGASGAGKTAQKADEAEDDATEEAPPPPDGLSVTQILSAKPQDDREALASGWEAGQRALKAELKRSWPVIPDAFERMSAALDVLNSAGQRGELQLEDGRKLGAFAFPDFSRVDARVLLVADGDEHPEVIALHRHPRVVGTVVPGGTLALPTADPEALAERLVGRAAPGGGELFAVEADAVYLKRGSRVYRWDGKREQEQGSVSQALASLILRWTQR